MANLQANRTLSGSFAEVWVDGVWQQVPKGWYTAAATGLMAGRITGSGKLRVGAQGSVISVR